MGSGKAILIWGLLGLGLLFVLTRRSSGYSQEHYNEEPQMPFRPSSSTGGKHYINTKEWNITYNEDGLPIKMVKHVEAEVT